MYNFTQVATNQKSKHNALFKNINDAISYKIKQDEADVIFWLKTT